MKITKIDILKMRPEEGRGNYMFCRVYTDEGIYGDGEVALSYGFVANAAVAIMKDLAPMLIGEDPLNHEVLWQKLYRTCFWGRNAGPIIFGGISAFDLALWDIKGKAFGVPLWQLLGGKYRKSLRAYASQIQGGMPKHRRNCKTPEDYAESAREAVAEGFDAVKLNFFMNDNNGVRYDLNTQLGLLSPETLDTVEARIAATREAIGPKVDIILENHCYTDATGAIQIGNIAKKYGILYFEEPTNPQPDTLKFVHDETGLPIASGERIYSRWQYKRFLDKRAIQIIQPDLGNTGGITEVKKICDMAYENEAAVQIHIAGSPIILAPSLQMESTIANYAIHEYNVNFVAPSHLELGKYVYEPVNGKYTVPNIPGNGNELSDLAFACSDIITIQ